MSPLTRRLSRSEGDLYFPDSESQRDSGLSSCSPADNVTPVNIRSKHGSQDSGVRISMASDDSGLVLKSKTASALITTGLGLLGCAPGIIDDGSIDEEFTHDILMPLVHNMKKVNYNRRESGVSIASGIYEEISEDIPEKQIKQTMHVYEDPVDLILRRTCTPPPLPPRKFTDRIRIDSYSDDALDDLPASPSSFSSLRYTPATSLQFIPRCHTMPSKTSDVFQFDDVSTIKTGSSSSSTSSNIESDYLPMSPIIPNAFSTLLTESLYLPMSPVMKQPDSLYMDMNAANRLKL